MKDLNYENWRKACFNFQPGIKWLVSAVNIAPHVEIGAVERQDNRRFLVNALWDTGSTTTIICPEIVQAMNLEIQSIENVMHLLGYGDVNTYQLDMFLPEKVVFQKIKVIEMPIRNRYFDMIIGMDIIQLGEFCIKKEQGKITMSFGVNPNCKIKVK